MGVWHHMAGEHKLCGCGRRALNPRGGLSALADGCTDMLRWAGSAPAFPPRRAGPEDKSAGGAAARGRQVALRHQRRAGRRPGARCQGRPALCAEAGNRAKAMDGPRVGPRVPPAHSPQKAAALSSSHSLPPPPPY